MILIQPRGTAYNFHSLSDHSLRFIQQYKTMKNHNIFIGFEENIFSTPISI